jgi:probable F420-dependent oxidoreductase
MDGPRVHRIRVVRYSLQFPNRAGKFLPDWLGDGRFSDFGVHAEDAGFDAVSVYDHPFPEDGWLKFGHISLDPFVSLAAVGERTTRIKLMTNILVAGYRSPFVAAQALATIDRFSAGRMIVGLAAGYLEEEFQAIGAQYEGRGELADDAIAAMRDAWTGESVTREGHYPVHGHTMYPTPVQQPPPIWIGGNSPRAMRRAAELGDGWLPMSLNEMEASVSKSPPLFEFDQLRPKLDQMRRLREKSDRSGPFEICFAPFERYTRDWNEATDSLAANLSQYADCGVTWMTIVSSARSLTQLRDDVHRFGDVVIANDADR